jgi:hypothetical protein
LRLAASYQRSATTIDDQTDTISKQSAYRDRAHASLIQRMYIYPFIRHVLTSRNRGVKIRRKWHVLRRECLERKFDYSKLVIRCSVIDTHFIVLKSLITEWPAALRCAILHTCTLHIDTFHRTCIFAHSNLKLDANMRQSAAYPHFLIMPTIGHYPPIPTNNSIATDYCTLSHL